MGQWYDVWRAFLMEPPVAAPQPGGFLSEALLFTFTYYNAIFLPPLIRKRGHAAPPVLQQANSQIRIESRRVAALHVERAQNSSQDQARSGLEMPM